MPNCYYYDEQHNRCKCYANENLDELLSENAKLREENKRLREQNHHLMKGDVLHILTDQELADRQKHEREMQASVKALDNENAKLRELVRCWCPHMKKRVGMVALRQWGYLQVLCELGIEVE